MEDDWDLQAVVRGCAATSSTASSSTTTTTSFTTFQPSQQDNNFTHFEDPYDPRRGNIFEELHSIYKPFVQQQQQMMSPQMTMIPFSPLSVLGDLQQDLAYPHHSQIKQQQHVVLQQTQVQAQPNKSLSLGVNKSRTGPSQNPNSRSKKRKNNMKRVCHVPAESLSSDVWSWRKYGQKPIKGSPYPRGYYKCSTSKGCMARKQVERNRSDPGMFIVTYTAEHNHPMPTHRSSLSGSTRPKSETGKADEPNKPASTSSPSQALSPPSEKLDSSREDREEMAELEDEDDEFCVSNMALDDDLFAGLEDLTGPAHDDDFFPVGMQHSWLATNAATTAAGGG